MENRDCYNCGNTVVTHKIKYLKITPNPKGVLITFKVDEDVSEVEEEAFKYTYFV